MPATVVDPPHIAYAELRGCCRADDLSDCFDFRQSPIVFKQIPAALPAAYFLNNKRSTTAPDDDWGLLTIWQSRGNSHPHGTSCVQRCTRRVQRIREAAAIPWIRPIRGII